MVASSRRLHKKSNLYINIFCPLLRWHPLADFTKNLTIKLIFSVPSYGGILLQMPPKSNYYIDIFCAFLWWHPLIDLSKNPTITLIFSLPSYGGILLQTPQKIQQLHWYYLCLPMVAPSRRRHKKLLHWYFLCLPMVSSPRRHHKKSNRYIIIFCSFLWWHSLAETIKR